MSQPSPLTPARQRAQVLADSGDLTGAIALLERAVELGKVNLSEDDPDVLRTSYLLGQMLQKDDDPMGARRVLEDAYAAGLWRLGDSDALMLEISHDIGVVAEELGNRHEARKAFGRVAELGPATLGGGHWAVARARAYLGQETDASVRDAAAPRPQPTELPTQPVSTPPQPVGTPPQPVGTPPQPVGTPPAPVSTAPAPVSNPVDEPTTTLPIQPAAHEEPVAYEQSVAYEQPAAHEEPVAYEQSVAYEQPVAYEEPTAPIPTQPGPGNGRVQPPTPANQQQWPAPPTWHTPAPAYPQQAQTWHEQPPSWGGNVPTPAPHWPGAPQAYAQEKAQPKRTLGIFAAIAAVLAAVIAVSALVFVLANRSGDKGNSDVPTLGGKPPTDVVLHDEGARIRVTWSDPAHGGVSFLVAMAQPGQQLKPVSTLGPGTTSYEIGGLNANLNYCFAVVAVYRDNKFATSQQACTNRSSSTK